MVIAKGTIARLGALAAAMLAAGNGVAANLANLSLEQLVGMEVSSASRYSQPAIDAPAAVSTLTADDIRSFGYRTLADALRGIRGLHVTSDRNYDYLGARGFAPPGDYNARLLLLVDGVRFNDAAYDQASIGTEFNIDLGLIDRIEYVSGPGSSVYGPNAFFGVINVITRRPADLPAGTQAALELGTQRAAGASVRNVGRGEGGLEWLLSASRLRKRGDDLYFPEFDGPATSNGIAHGLDFDHVTNLFGRLVYGDLTLTATRGERIKGIPTASYAQVFDDPRPRTGDFRDSVSGEWRTTPADKLVLNARANFGRYRYTGDYIYNYPPVTVNRDELDGNWWGGELQLVSTAIDEHTVVAGAEYRQDRVEQRNFDVSPFASFIESSTRGRVWGIYAQDDVRLTRELALSAGVRYNHHSNSGGSLNPRLGLIWKPRPVTAVKLLYGSAYRPPNAYEQDYVPNPPGPPALRAETIKSGELVVEHAPAPGQRLLWTLFRNEVKNQIVALPAAGCAIAPFSCFVNIPGVTADGMEIEAERRFENGHRLRGSISVQSARDKATGARLTNSPRRLLKLQAAGPIGKAGLRYGIEAIAVDRRLSLAGEVPGYAIVNLNLLADRILPGLDLSLGIQNLFAQKYADPGGVEHVQDSLRRDGRTAMLRATLSF